MKQKLHFILVLLFVGYYANTQTPAFTYGDFEEDSTTLAEEWIFYVMPSNAQSILFVNSDADYIYSGSQSLGSRKNGYLTQNGLEVKSETDYVVTVRTKGDAADTKFKITSSLFEDGAKTSEFNSFWTGSVPDTAWQLQQFGFTTPTGADSISIMFGNPNGASICYFDDVQIMEGIPDLKPPLAPDSLYAVFVNEESVRLSWPVAVDSIGDGIQDAYMYRVFRDDEEIATTMDTTYLDENVSGFTTYLYKVSSVDMMENEGDTTNFISVLTVGINDNYNRKDIEIYPNPANEVLFIRSVKEVKSIQVYSITGKQVFETINTSETTEISLGHLQQGIYLVKCNYVDGMGSVMKLLKE